MASLHHLARNFPLLHRTGAGMTEQVLASAPTRPAPWWTIALLRLLICVAGVAAFANALPDEFVFDSRPIVRDHPHLEPDFPWWRLPLQSYWGPRSTAGLYRPATMLTYRAERELLGFRSPAAFAVTNIVLHVLVAQLVFSLARAWTGSLFAGAVAGLLFVVHPIATETVPNLVGRADLLATIGVVGGLLTWERWLHTRRWRWVALTAAVWALGLFSKESAAVLPAIALVRAWWLQRDEGDPRVVAMSLLRHSGAAFVVLGVLGVTWLALRGWVLSHFPPVWTSPLENPILIAGPIERLLTVGYVFALHVRQAIFPLWLSGDYSMGVIPVVEAPADPRIVLAVAAPFMAAVVTALAWWRRHVSALGILFFLIALLPVSNLLVTIGTIMADRLVYTPLVGAMIAAGAAAASAWDLARRREASARWGRAVLVGLLLLSVGLLGVRTHLRNRAWITSDGFWRQTLEDMPQSYKVWRTATFWPLREEMDAEALLQAIDRADRAMAVAEGIPDWALNDLLLDAAATRIDFATKIDDAATARRALGDAVVLLERARAAYEGDNPGSRYMRRLIAFLEARDEDPPREIKRVPIYSNLAKAYYLLGEYGRAAEVLAQTVAFAPDDAELWAMLGRSLANTGRFDNAERALQRAVELEPDEPSHTRDLERLRAVRARLNAPSQP